MHFMLFLLHLASLFHVATPIFSSISTSMFSNSVESDFLSLRYSTSTSAVNASYPGGVFATETFELDHIICQPRGHLIPMENASRFTTNTILTYIMAIPPQTGAGTEQQQTQKQKQYALVDNTICSRIRFCFPSPVGDAGRGSCGNAQLVRFTATGLLFVQPLKVIPAWTEIIVELHDYYILDWEHFNERCHFDPHGCGISSYADTTPKQLGVIASESFSLYLAPSSIPGVGLGLFSTISIPPYHIITPCQGKVYHYLYHADAERMDRLTAVQRTSKYEVVIQMDNFCGYTNDIIDIGFMNNSSFTEEDMKREGSVPRLPDMEYNAVQGGGEYRFSAIISLRHIPAHTEIFQPYGESYWWHRYTENTRKQQQRQLQEEEQVGSSLDCEYDDNGVSARGDFGATPPPSVA